MTATVTLSLEVELGWGAPVGNNYSVLSESRESETNTLNSLLKHCDKLEIPFTFDIVGHLFHESCSGNHPSPHDNGWFRNDPGTNIKTDPQFYAPDLISEITDSQAEHEIATHTYSHALLDEISRETIEWEFNQAKDQHADAQIDLPKSLVPPCHRDVPLDIVRESGIETVRTPFVNYRRPDTSGKVSSLHWLITRTHPVGFLMERKGVILTPCTHHPSLSTPLLPQGQQSVNPLLRVLLPTPIRQRIHRQYLQNAVDRVIERNSHLHLWTHLFNISNKKQSKPLFEFLRYLSAKAKNGEIHLRTMDELPEALA
jgi:UV DNA damage repair endonuclease